MKHKLLIISTLLVISLPTLFAQRKSKPEIDASIRFERDTIMVGEPVYCTYVIRNLTTHSLCTNAYLKMSRFHDGSFEVHVFDPSGKEITINAFSILEQSGREGLHPLEPNGGTFISQVYLPEWASFDKPGKYRIEICRSVNLLNTCELNAQNYKKNRLTQSSATATLTVIPNDSLKMGQLIDRYTSIMLNLHEDYTLRDRCANMLSDLKDERIIPIFIRVLQTMPHLHYEYFATKALANFPTNEIAYLALREAAQTSYEQLLPWYNNKEAAVSQAQSIRHFAVNALAKHQNCDLIPFLISLKDDEYAFVRQRIEQILYRLGPEQAKPLLELYQNDPDKGVRSEALRFLEMMKKGK